MVLRRDESRGRVDAVVILPVDDEAHHAPARRLLGDLALEGAPADERAVVIGQPTCGCLLGFLGYAKVPGGAELAYSEVGFMLTNGKRIEGEGVIPDHTVPLVAADLVVGRDRALEKAQEVLQQKIAARGAKPGA